MSEEKVNDLDSESVSGSGLKGIGVILTIIALITGVAAIIRPMQNEQVSLSNRVTRMEQRVGKQICDVEVKLHRELLINNENIEKQMLNLDKQLNKFEDYNKDQILLQKEILSKQIKFLDRLLSEHLGYKQEDNIF